MHVTGSNRQISSENTDGIYIHSHELQNGGNVWLLNIWGKESAPFIQALHFAFGFGGFTGPLIAAPFLSTQPDNNCTEIQSSSTGCDYITNISTRGILDDSFEYEQPVQYFNETGAIYSNGALV